MCPPSKASTESLSVARAPEESETVVTSESLSPSILMSRYHEVLEEPRLNWIEQHRIVRKLGSGGQGVVYLCERLGADRFTLPVAVKFFSPQGYAGTSAYDEAMARMAQVAMRVAQIQQDNLLDVQNFVEVNRIRVLEMEWVDGYDLQQLLTNTMMGRLRDKVSAERLEYLDDVIFTQGITQPRLKPGVAIAVLRDCLSALSALHRDGVVHGDVKPSNIMLKRTGNAKLIDIGSAYEWGRGASARTCTPAYAAPEVLAGEGGSPLADLASLGYVLLEILSGAPPFAGRNLDALLEAKRSVLDRLEGTLPEDVVRNEILMNLVMGLINPDPAKRFPSAEDADLVEQGAASFQRQLVKGNLSSEYDNEIRVWLEEID